MAADRSLASRVAWAAAIAAGASALLAAAATGIFSGVLLQRAEDHALHEAAFALAAELGESSSFATRAAEITRNESIENDSPGLLLSTFDSKGNRIAGDLHVPLLRDGCRTEPQLALRVCAVVARNGLVAVAAGAHNVQSSALALATVLSAALAGCAAWLVSRPLSRRVMSPLARLRDSIAKLGFDAERRVDLGKNEQVLEVDLLRETLKQLIFRANQAIEQARRFAANAAHELRTPLTAIHAELELLAEDPGLASGPLSSVHHVERKVAELSAVLERLLVLATPKGAPGEATEIVSLRDLLEDTRDALPPSIRASVHLSDADATVRGDAVLLQMLVSNALSNALKFGRDVRIELLSTNGWTRLCFQDDGPGVPREERERIFEPFERGSALSTEQAPGYGLGLALIRHVAEVHRGSASFVEAESGARLEVTLPIAGSGT